MNGGLTPADVVALMLPSASQLERAEACPPSEAFRHTATAGSKHTRLGIVVHQFVAALNDGHDRAVLLGLTPEFAREFCAAIDPKRLPITKTSRAEIGFALNVRTLAGRELGAHEMPSDGDHRYRVQPGELPGTADLVDVDGGRFIVYDYKSGFAKLGPARDSFQLQMLALAGARATGCTVARVGYVYLRPDGAAYYDVASLDEWALEGISARVVRLAERIATARTQWPSGAMQATGDPAALIPLRLGDHCGYCPAVADCPAHLQLARAAIGDPASVSPPARLTTEVVARAWEVQEALERMAAMIRGRCYNYASQYLVPLGKGMVLGPVTESKRAIVDVTQAALTVLTEYGPEVAAAAVEKSMSQASLRAALKEHRPDLPITAAMKEAMEKLAQGGAVRARSTTSVKPHERELPALEAPRGA